MPQRRVAAKHRLEYALLLLLIQMFRFAPARLARALLRLNVFFLRRLNPRHVRLLQANLARAFPALSAAERGDLQGRIYDHFTRVLAELLRAAGQPDSDALAARIEVRNAAALERALAGGKGVVIFSAHFGNWEWLPLALSRHLGRPLTSIARPMDNPLIERRLLRLRERWGSRIIHRQGALRRILAGLEANEPVYLLVDQNTVRREAVFVDFFGCPAATVPTPAHLHLRRGVPLLPAFFFADKTGAVVEIGEPVAFTPGSDRDADVQRLTQQLSAVIEEQIRRRPEQWLWFHDRWKTQPQGACHEK